jgi:hypothetical protein
MNPKPESRTEASKPEETKHLAAGQKRALDASAEIEHTDGKAREELTRHAENAAGSKPKPRD